MLAEVEIFSFFIGLLVSWWHPIAVVTDNSGTGDPNKGVFSVSGTIFWENCLQKEGHKWEELIRDPDSAKDG